MKAWEREAYILEQLKQRGAISLTEICEQTGASVATVRRDFEELRRKGMAERTHGGLRLPEQKKTAKAYIQGTEILDATDEEKYRIAKAAAATVRSGESIFIGAGKTCNFLASMLGQVEHLNVVTTSITAVLELVDCPKISLTLLGGDVHRGANYIETMDTDLGHSLRGLYFDKVFMTVDGIDRERGYTVRDRGQIALYTQLSRITRRLYILADGGKFDRRAFASVFPMDKTCRMITTEHMPEAYREFYAGNGISCTVAEME